MERGAFSSGVKTTSAMQMAGHTGPAFIQLSRSALVGVRDASSQSLIGTK